jgi:hypothetical protein
MDTGTLLKQGIAALKAGQKAEARRLLGQVVQQDRNNETAWLWLSGAVDADRERIHCLRETLRINPNNQHARHGLEQLEGKVSHIAPIQTRREKASVRPLGIQTPPAREEKKHDAEPAEVVLRAHVEDTKQCPYCAETIKAEAVVCRFCGRDLATGQAPSVPHPATSAELQPSLLDRRIESFVKKGWRVVNRTLTAAQLEKPKQWSQGCLILFVVIPLLGGFLFPPLWGVAIIALLLAVADYALKRDQTVYLTEEQLLQEKQRRLEEQRRREEQARRGEQERLERQSKREEERRLKEERRRAEQAAKGSKQIMGLNQQEFWLVMIGGVGIIVIAIAIAVILAQ